MGLWGDSDPNHNSMGVKQGGPFGPLEAVGLALSQAVELSSETAEVPSCVLH